MLKLLKRFQSEERGNIAIIFGFAIIPFMIAAGVSVDYARAVVTKHRLQHAMDTAVLAAGSMTNASETERKALGKAFFEANYPPAEFGLNVGTDFISINDNIVSADETTSVKTTLMRLANLYDPLTEMGIQADSQATVPVVANAEVALVLDYSGSMGSSDPAAPGDKYENMAAAAVSLIDTLTKDGTETDRVKFALAPFASQMYGTFDMANIRTDKKNAQGNSSSSSTWSGCFGDREYPYSRNDTAPSSGITGSGFGERTASDSSRSYYYSCSSSYQARPFYRLTNDYSTLKDAINAWTPGGGTHISLGTAMGWHLVSPNAPFADGVSYTHNDAAAEDDKVVKVVVLLTDGVQTRRAEGSSSYSSSNGNPNTSALCTAMKAQDIVVITIGYDLYSTSTLTMLENCASEPSSKYFFNVDGSQGNISDAFDAIGQAISDMVYLSH